jgi:tetratricopeptide (TPR) repeat protein
MRWQSQTKLALARGDAATQFPRGLVYLQQSGPAEAGTLCEEGVAAQPEHANAQYEYGKILLDNGEVENTTPHLESAARLSPRPDYVHCLHCQLQAACRKDRRTADADREFDFYEKINRQNRGRASGESPNRLQHIFP